MILPAILFLAWGYRAVKECCEAHAWARLEQQVAQKGVLVRKQLKTWARRFGVRTVFPVGPYLLQICNMSRV